MAIEKRIAWRFMLMGTEKASFSPMTLFAWLAIGVGVGAMSSLLSVMYGFEASLRDHVLKAYPHVLVRPVAGSRSILDSAALTEKLKRVEGVERLVPYLEGEMIVQSDARTLGGVVWGLDPEALTRLQKEIEEGKVPNAKSKVPEVVVGSALADRLRVRVGDQIRVVSPLERGGAMGMVPRLDWFRVSGLYTSGHYEFDQQYLFLLMEDARDLMKKPGAISGWQIWTPNQDQSRSVQARIAPLLSEDLEAVDWSVFNSALFQSLKLEQYAMFTILSFAVAIAVLNIVITLMMHVTHKKKNIGILRAIGASRQQIRSIFTWQGIWLGAVGLCLGAILTTGFVVYARHFSSYQLPEIYYDRSIPIELRPFSIALIYAVAVVMIYLATIFPAAQAANLDPIEAIRE